MTARKKPIVHSDPEVMGGTPVFFGTRVPVETLFDWLEHGYTLDYYLENFPSVKREQAVAALRSSSKTLVASAHPS
jgi:uncharacterized protein (DUF433 family)